MATEFMLQEGEKIVKDIIPLKNLLYMWAFTAIVGWGITILFIGGFMFIPIGFALLGWIGGILAFFMMMGFSIVPGFITAWLRYQKRHYWITSKRVIFKSGFIGYKINSVPLERISDVTISRSFVESIFGFGSIHIQSMAGQVNMGNPLGSEAALVACPEPEMNQKLIFELIKKKRKAEGITM